MLCQGTPTTMWFTPLFTTEEMKQKTGNPEFEYEISCDQMCGEQHYAMKGIIKVVTQQEFDLWIARQKSNYVQINQSAPAPAPTGTTTDTAAKVTTAAVTPVKATTN
jgi:cytochrome c oxidase subunit II